MAASNYYGFPHTSVATPYSTPPITAYCTPATTYAVQQVPGVANAVTPSYSPVVQAVRPITSVTYGAYPTHAADYGYGTRQPEPPPQTMTTPSYQDTYSYGRATAATNYENKQYYQPVATQAAHTATDSYYQTGSKGSYSPSSSGYTQPQRHVTPIKTVQTVNTTGSSYVVYPVMTTVQQIVPTSTVPSYTPVSTYNSTTSSYSGTSYTGYDPTVYPTSGTYYQPQQHQQPPLPQQPPPQPPPSQQHPQKSSGPTSWSNAGNRTNTNSSTNVNKKTPYQNKQFKPKGPPKQPQIHYCDICKISCAGPQTYREHLEGQKHKKKEAVLKSGSPTTNGPRGVATQLRCELCDVSCTGADAYAAHISGSKHQKVVKLHTKLGKPIPFIEPITMDSMPDSSTTPNSTTPITMASKVASSMTSRAPTTPTVLTVNNASSTVKPAQLMKPATTKITFVGSNKHQPVLVKPEPLINREQVKVAVSMAEFQNDNFTQDDFGDNLVGPAPTMNPVGDEFVEEVCNDEGKIIRFHCKLCECSFNDPSAKDMHLKGRRHRLQFKKKINPQFPVEIKPSNRARKLQEEMKKLKQKDLIRRRRDDEQRFHLERRRYEQGMYWRRVEEEKIYWEKQRRLRAPDWHPPPLMGRPGLPVPPLMVGNNFNIRGFQRRDLKIPRIQRLFGLPPECDSPHTNRRPDSFEDRYIMFKHSKIYPSEEELLAIQKLVSHSERSLKLVSDTLTEQNTDKKEEDNVKEKGTRDLPSRCLKGVMRVGVLAKGLLLRGDRNVKLILLSEKKPTTSLLQKVAELLPKQLSDLTQDKYEVSLNLKESNITIASFKEPKMQAIISIASPLLRDEETDKEEEKESHLEPPDLINKQKCMDSMAALRHAKWFQARANGLQSCVIVIRILRDLCHRVPTWSAFPNWAMELLVEMALSSVSGPLSPGDALRRVLECIASGTLLPGGPGLPDPCEKDHTDVLKSMTNQQREDITASAQHALRMVAFRQINRVLGIQHLPPSKHKPLFYNRKRRRDTTQVDDEGDGKKDRKDDNQEA